MIGEKCYKFSIERIDHTDKIDYSNVKNDVYCKMSDLIEMIKRKNIPEDFPYNNEMLFIIKKF